MYPNLKLAIFKRGLQQNHLARHLGMDETLLSKIIRGYREPTEFQRRALAGFLNVAEEWLFEKYEVSPANRQYGMQGENGESETSEGS